MCIVCTIHVWCAFCHTIIKGYLHTYYLLQTNLFPVCQPPRGFRLPVISDNIVTVFFGMLDPDNVGIGVGISLLSHL